VAMSLMQKFGGINKCSLLAVYKRQGYRKVVLSFFT
jgi:hypothetical protein